MPASKPYVNLKDWTFYQLTSHMTSTFTSCMNMYETLLPHFENEIKEDNGIYIRLLLIDEILNKLNRELATLKTEFATAGDEHKSKEQSIPCKEVKTVNESAKDQSIPCKEGKTVKKPESVRIEDVKTDHEVTLDKEHCKKKETSDFQYLCDKCGTTIIVYNEDIDLSVALHTQEGCYMRECNKTVKQQCVEEKKTVPNVSTQEPPKHHEDTIKCKPGKSPQHLKYTAEHEAFDCIKSAGNGFICTVCEKILSGPKVIAEHVRGSSHQKLLKDTSNDVPKNESSVPSPVPGMQAKNITNKLADNNMRKETVPLPDSATMAEKVTALARIIKSLSGSAKNQRQYLSHETGVIRCNLCKCDIPPTEVNVRDHVLGSRHSKNQMELLSPSQ